MASKSDFKDVANENNYSVRSINAIKDLDENIPGIGSQRSIVRWMYEAGTDVGDFKRFNLQNGGYVVAMLTSVNKAGLMSNEKLLSQLCLWLRIKRKLINYEKNKW